ncbi:MAG: 50S ribosomal protein L10 [Acidobacteriota bacterium]
MERSEKHEQVTVLRERFGAASHAFVVDFQGLTVAMDTDLRNQLRKAEVDYRVVKNRLALLAMEGTGLASLGGHFRGPTAVALTQGDPVAIAKVLVDFAKDHPALKIKGGVLEGGHGLNTEGVEALSRLPSLPELRAKILSAINGPAGKLVSVLSQPGQGLARVLDARRAQLAEQG